MLKELVKKFDAIIPNPFPVDPARFHDPVALQTEWRGVMAGRVSRGSNKLVQTGPDQLAYKPSVSSFIGGAIFALIGGFAVVFYFLIASGSSQGISFSGSPIFLAGVGLVFMAAGIGLIFQATSPVVFDKRDGAFYKGRRQRRQLDAADSRHAVRFADIHAIQLLVRLEARTNDGNMNDNIPRRTRYVHVYDLNLVRHDGQRMYVTTYGKPERAKEDAAKISALVDAPVWDAIDY